VHVVTISSWLNFGRPAPPGSGSVAGRNFWLRLTTASAQCLRLSERFSKFLLSAFVVHCCTLLWISYCVYHTHIYRVFCVHCLSSYWFSCQYLLSNWLESYHFFSRCCVVNPWNNLHPETVDFPHWEILSTAFDFCSIWHTVTIRAVDSAPWSLSVRTWLAVIVYFICRHVCQC